MFVIQHDRVEGDGFEGLALEIDASNYAVEYGWLEESRVPDRHFER